MINEIEDSFINDTSFDESVTTTSVRKCPLKRVIQVDQSVQVSLEISADEQQIRNNRNTTEEIKNAICTVSYRSGVSVPKARIAVQAVCEKLYNHKYYLQPPKPLSTIEEVDEPEEPKNKKPRTVDQYTEYKDVLPSAKTVNEYKHKKALHQEIQAAKLLVEKEETTKVTLHYDTTTQLRIEGEWPCLILNFLDKNPDNCHMISLRPLFFAFEDRQQITSLVVETLQRLATTTQGSFSAKFL